MKSTIQKWGNSLAVRIPKAFAEELNVRQDSEVNLSLQAGELVIRPLAGPRYSLSEMVKEIVDERLHAEVDTGPAVGDEAWK